MGERIFLSSAHNRPAGGVKVLNQVCNLFREKGYESYVVVPGEPEQASWMGNPAPVITLKDMAGMCRKEDIIIDGWQKTEIYETTMSCPARIKVFWSQGASIPVGRDYVGSRVFESGYTHHWNVSKACKEYIEEVYNLKGIDIVHPFFDDDEMKQYLAEKGRHQRNGILCVGRRGISYLPYILGCPENKVTVIHGFFPLSDLYGSLLRHRFFISYDPGIGNPGWRIRTSLRISNFLPGILFIKPFYRVKRIFGYFIECTFISVNSFLYHI